MTQSSRRIDHVVHAVHDLEAAGDFYRRLGFQVGARNRHPWGTENRIAQFRSSFVEIIAVGVGAEVPPHAPGQFSFGAFVRDYLRERQGLAMVVLDSTDARDDAARFAEAGIGAFEPFFFERASRRADGSEARVAFTLAFAADPTLPNCSFFVCQQHFPESFWSAAFQKHPNGASDIRAVTVVAPVPRAHATFLEAFSGSLGQAAGRDRIRLPLRNGGHLDVEPGTGEGGLVSFTVAVPDPVRQAGLLAASAISCDVVDDQVIVRAADAFGVDIAFVEG